MFLDHALNLGVNQENAILFSIGLVFLCGSLDLFTNLELTLSPQCLIADDIFSLIAVCLFFTMGVIALIGVECSQISSFELSSVDYIPDLDDPIVDSSNKGDPENFLR